METGHPDGGQGLIKVDYMQMQDHEASSRISAVLSAELVDDAGSASVDPMLLASLTAMQGSDGYDRMIHKANDDAVMALAGLRAELVDSIIVRHQGSVHDAAGSGYNSTFHSAANALRCALDIQFQLAERNSGLPIGQNVQLRIGIHSESGEASPDSSRGELMATAQRLRGLAHPQEIVVSDAARNSAGLDHSVEFHELGVRSEGAKGHVLRAYKVIRKKPETNIAPAQASLTARPSRQWWWSGAAGMTLLLAVFGSWLIWRNAAIENEVASESRMRLPLPAEPSIAVLPFTNMSGDPQQEYFVDGMTDDLITDLSKISGLLVISRNSTFIYKGKPAKVSQVAEDLGVRFVLEGSVQRNGDRLRVNAQLIDAMSGGHVWADRFDGKADDLFSTQDQFLSKIVAALKVSLTPGQRQEIANTRPGNLDAKTEFDEGWSLYLKFTPRDTAAAIEALKRAVEIDPEYGRAYAALALAEFRIYDSLWARELGLDPYAVWYTGQDYLALADKFPTSLSFIVGAQRSAYAGQSIEARRLASQALARDPNDPEAHLAMAWALTISGNGDEALNFVAAAMRLNPNYPSHYVLAKGLALFTRGDFADAVATFEQGIEANPSASLLLVPLSSTLAQLGRREEARETLQKFRPGADQRGLENLPNSYVFPLQWDTQNARKREQLYDGLRIAALPLDVDVRSLTKIVQTSTGFAKLTAVQQLGWFGPQAADAVPVLTEALEDKLCRVSAIVSLGKIGSKAQSSLAALKSILDDGVAGIYAREAIASISDD